MRTVIIRHGYHIDDNGYIHYDESKSTYEKADEIIGYRLDRRKNYAIIDGEVHEICEWTDACSGCTEGGDYGSIYGPFGCDECGYTGKRRHQVWVKVNLKE